MIQTNNQTNFINSTANLLGVSPEIVAGVLAIMGTQSQTRAVMLGGYCVTQSGNQNAKAHNIMLGRDPKDTLSRLEYNIYSGYLDNLQTV